MAWAVPPKMVLACLFLTVVPMGSRANGPEPEAIPTLAAPTASSGEKAVDFWRSGQGLPNNTVNAVLQTRDGYLWVGTAAGLARFDGLVFTTLGDETARGLKDAAITALMEQRDGALWVGTQDGGVFRLQGGQALRFTVAQGLADNAVTSLAEDGSGRVWIGTQRGLNLWERGVLTVFTSPLVGAGDSIVALHAGRSGRLWITTRSGVFSLKDQQPVRFRAEGLPEGRNGEFIGVYEDRSGNLWGFGATFLLNLTQGRRFNYFRSLELASSQVWTICEQEDGTFWIGTSGRGLFRFQGERFDMAGVREGLDQCDVRALYADHAGNLWIGTSGNGLARLRTRRVRFLGATDGLNSQAVSAIAADGDQVWIATLDQGLLHWDGRRVAPFGGGPPLDRIAQVQSVCTDRQGSLWVGTVGSGLWRVAAGRQQRFGMAEGLSDDVVLVVAADRQTNAVWAGTREGSLHRLRGDVMETFGPADGLSGSAILALLPAEDGTMIVGSEAGGLRRWDGKRFAPVSVPRELGANPVRCLFSDSKGRLWVGTWGGGAFCREGDAWKRLGIRQGLPTEAVGQMFQDEVGNMWFGTDEDLVRVRAPEVEAWLRGERDTVTCLSGVPGDELRNLKCPAGYPGVARAGNGGLWVAVSTGLLPLGGRSRMTADPPPPVIIERVLVNGQAAAAAPGGLLRLGPGARSLDFAFTAVSFNAPQRVRFRHKIENFDADWVDSGLARRAHYGPLPPGQYRFHVIAVNADGVWNEAGASQEFIVTPSVWRSWWFVTLCGLAGAGGIWAVVRFIWVRRLQARLRVARQQHAMERERARIARDMHDEIGSKLTRISFLSEVARNPDGEAPTASIDAIASTSRELLHALDELVWAVNPRNDSLEQVAGYLGEYAREYFQAISLECEIQVPAELPAARLSAEVRHNVFLALKEALTNVLKHAQATRVSIAMSLEGQQFEIRIQDNGRGFAPRTRTKPEQNGLGNMRARLAAMGGACEISSEPGGGTTVRLRFPVAAQMARIQPESMRTSNEHHSFDS